MMFLARPFTLFFTLSLILAVVFPVADAHLDSPPARRHVPAIHRMLKKRVSLISSGVNDAAAGDRVVQNAAVQPSPEGSLAQSPPVPTSSAPTNSAPRVPQRPSATTGSPAPSNTATPIIPDNPLISTIVSDVLGPSPTSLNSSSLLPLTLTSSTPSSIPLTTSSLSTPTALPETSAVSQVTVTSSSTETPTATASTSGHSVTKIQRNTIIILIAIGASIGAAGLIWTIIRKWKFRPSSSFEDRMQPIDWQPTPSGNRDVTEKLGRNPSVASHGSFTSGDNHNHLADLPPHDFTAGASHLAPVGGYADLHRGPSPQPDYRSNSPYHYDVPNPHGPYYNNAGGYQGGNEHIRGY